MASLERNDSLRTLGVGLSGGTQDCMRNFLPCFFSPLTPKIRWFWLKVLKMQRGREICSQKLSCSFSDRLDWSLPTGWTPFVLVEKKPRSIPISTLTICRRRSCFPGLKNTLEIQHGPFNRTAHSFSTASEWPANSPGLNIVDYCVRSILEEHACAKLRTTIHGLKSFRKKHGR